MLNNHMVYEHIWNYPQIMVFRFLFHRKIGWSPYGSFGSFSISEAEISISPSWCRRGAKATFNSFPVSGSLLMTSVVPKNWWIGDDHPSLPWSEPRAKEVMVLAETRWKVGDHLDLSPEIIPLSLHMSPCQRCWWVWWWSSHSRRQRLPRHQSCGGWWVFQHKSQWIRFVGKIFSGSHQFLPVNMEGLPASVSHQFWENWLGYLMFIPNSHDVNVGWFSWSILINPVTNRVVEAASSRKTKRGTRWGPRW